MLDQRVGKIDALDTSLIVAYALGLAAILGFATFQAFGFTFSDPIVQVNGATVTLAGLVSTGAVAVAYLTNSSDLSDYGDDALGYAAILTVFGTVSVSVFESVQQFLTAQPDLFGIGLIGVMTAGYVAIAYY